MAENTAWNGVLVAPDAALGVRSGLKKNQRPEFKDYQAAISKKDSKMTRPLLGAYESLHKTLGYDSNPNDCTGKFRERKTNNRLGGKKLSG